MEEPKDPRPSIRTFFEIAGDGLDPPEEDRFSHGVFGVWSKGSKEPTQGRVLDADPSDLKESLETGELSDDVRAVVIFDPEADRKAPRDINEPSGSFLPLHWGLRR